MEAKGNNRTQDIRIENFDIAYGDRCVVHKRLKSAVLRVFLWNYYSLLLISFILFFYYLRVLLQGADITLAFGRRYGLVGRNGLGKTTLLRMISSGQLRIPSHITILHVEQEVQFLKKKLQ